MSLKVVHLAAQVEESDSFHLARILILLSASSGRSQKPIQGIMKLAKLDFLLRYPNCLVRALEAVGKGAVASSVTMEERNTIEARMIRFRFGPWDKRYRKWISLLVARGLASTYMEGRTVNVKLTDEGMALASKIAAMEDFKVIADRSKAVASAVGSYSATKLKDFIYTVFPEITTMRWGSNIEL
jgi:predicted transcriptional regulator